MKNLKFSIIIVLTTTLSNSALCMSKETTFSNAQKEEFVIPPEAHEKAIQALKALGPSRGAKKIDYSVVKIGAVSIDIIGVAKEFQAKSENIQVELKDLGAKETETEYQIDLPGDVLFDFDKWGIRPVAEEILMKVGNIIKKSKSPKVIISGHTDSKGSEEYNQRLSEKRAESVKNWLAKNTDAVPNVMETAGFGESKPIAPNTNPDGSDNAEGRQKNRRVEILIKKQ